MHRLAVDADPGGRVATGWCRDNSVRSGRKVDRVAAVRAGHRIHAAHGINAPQVGVLERTVRAEESIPIGTDRAVLASYFA